MATGEFIFTDIKCKQCDLYREWLELEIQQKNAYRDLLLGQNVRINTEVSPDLSTFSSIHKGISLSSLRQQLEREAHGKASVAKPTQLTKEELLFEETLNNVRQEENPIVNQTAQ